jgi:hypothetical protein
MENTSTPAASSLSQTQEVAESLQRVRSWYGLEGEIGVEDELWHLVKVAGIPLPHPPLVNLILRAGLPEDDRLKLSFLHEFGHLQTFPIALLHALGFIWLYFRGGNKPQNLLKIAILGLVAHQATWELASETYALIKARDEYRQIYRRHPNPKGQGFFWGGMAAVSAIASTWFFRR